MEGLRQMIFYSLMTISTVCWTLIFTSLDLIGIYRNDRLYFPSSMKLIYGIGWRKYTEGTLVISSENKISAKNDKYRRAFTVEMCGLARFYFQFRIERVRVWSDSTKSFIRPEEMTIFEKILQTSRRSL